nr:tRNA (cytosine-5-)-methyltransferase-like isoform X2 [Chelonoidis abingdonii]
MGPVRVLELYSGIGGMHQALTESCISAEVVAAVDVNTVANEVYKHNFPSTPLWAKTIEVSNGHMSLCALAISVEYSLPRLVGNVESKHLKLEAVKGLLCWIMCSDDFGRFLEM